MSVQVLKVTSMKIFWDIAPYSLLELIYVSEVLTAYIIRTMSLWNVGRFLRDYNAQYHRTVILKSCWILELCPPTKTFTQKFVSLARD
jgi:hypothetical protein